MKNFKRKYIVNEQNEKIAVQLDISTFEKIERDLGDYVMGKKIKENAPTERLSVNEAVSFYKKLKKKN